MKRNTLSFLQSPTFPKVTANHWCHHFPDFFKSPAPGHRRSFVENPTAGKLKNIFQKSLDRVKRTR
jgi:hypothetical protein